VWSLKRRTYESEENALAVALTLSSSHPFMDNVSPSSAAPAASPLGEDDPLSRFANVTGQAQPEKEKDPDYFPGDEFLVCSLPKPAVVLN